MPLILLSIYRAAGAKSENCVLGKLDMAKTPKPNGLLITDGKVSKFIDELIKEAGFEKIGSLASGNRAMMVNELLFYDSCKHGE